MNFRSFRINFILIFLFMAFAFSLPSCTSLESISKMKELVYRDAALADELDMIIASCTISEVKIRLEAWAISHHNLIKEEQYCIAVLQNSTLPPALRDDLIAVLRTIIKQK